MRDSLPQVAPSRRWRGPIYLTISAILFAGMVVFVRMASDRGIPGGETTLIRFIAGLIAVIGMHLFGFTRLVVRRHGWLAARGISGGLAILFYFLSLSATKGPGQTPLTNSVLLSNSYFVFVPLFGALIIREKLRSVTVVAVLIAFAGIYLVINPSLGGVRIGDVYGVISGITAGLAIVTMRELRKTEPAPVIFLSLCFFGAIISGGVVAIQRPVSPDAATWLILAGMAVTATAAQLLMTHAFRYIRAGEGSLIAMTTIIYSSAAGIIVFHEPFTARFAVGALLVFGSAGYLAMMYDGSGDGV